jgi:hypothetical protein
MATNPSGTLLLVSYSVSVSIYGLNFPALMAGFVSLSLQPRGYQEDFPLVKAIIACAPNIRGWSFIALKPPMGFDFTTNYEGILFDPSSMWFLPLVSNSRPQELGLRVGVPNLIPAIKRQAGNAVLVILDTAFG